MPEPADPQLQADAARLLSDPALPRTLERVVSHYRKLSEESEGSEVELREDCYRQLRAIREFHRELTTLSKGGKLRAMRGSRGGSDPAAA